jgi:serine/threonine-protein kinase HipA
VIGAVALREGDAAARFDYTKEFIGSGVEVSPFGMPLSSRVYSFPALPKESFHGLPGLLSDSLPDRFGNALINAWLARQGRAPGDLNPVERLCYVGERGMGALEFRPSTGPDTETSTEVDVAELVRLASAILQERSGWEHSLSDADEHGLEAILKVGTSAGGARAKALIAWNPATNEVKSGQLQLEPPFEHWMLKFDGVSNNRDRELADTMGFGRVEMAYHRMAVDCGIVMMPCRLHEEGGRAHFMTRRFDRTPNGQKVHMQSLAGLRHFDFNAAGAHGYEEAIQTIRNLGGGRKDVEQMVRRAIFNVVARNQDDHVKNIAFLMDRKGKWSLAPAFDLTWSYNPDGIWTGSHQMSVNGKRDAFSRKDIDVLGEVSFLPRGLALQILDQVLDVVSGWRDYARESGVSPDQTADIGRTHCMGLGS